LYGEKSGFIPTPEWKKKTRKEKWYIGDTYHISIGQGDILVTPIQVANYTAAIANGGKLFQPHLIEKIVSFDGKIKYKSIPVFFPRPNDFAYSAIFFVPRPTKSLYPPPT